MSGIFPIRQSVDLGDERGHKLVGLDDDVADDVFEALSAGTTRQVFRELHESPQTASDLAAVTDTSVQNVQYHLEKLIDVDLVEVADVWYSERGTEMKVYAPTDESLVLFAGRDAEGTLRSLLKRLAGGVGVLAPATVLVWALLDRFLAGDGPDNAFGAGDGGADGGEAVQIAAESTRSAAESAGGMDPAVVAAVAFFVGGAFVLTVAATFWYWRQ